MNETEFLDIAAELFERIETALDAADIEYSINEGVMEMEFDDGSKIIVSRHVPNREIWLAARSGGFHYRLTDGAWRDTRSGEEFHDRLGQCIAAQGGGEVAF